MPLSPALWGASLACALGGAFAGASFGSSPVVANSGDYSYAAAHDQGGVSVAPGQEALPDHYPLVTREGVVPVERLSERGLYSQARYRTLYGLSSDDALAVRLSADDRSPQTADIDPGPGRSDVDDTSSTTVRRAESPDHPQVHPAPIEVASGSARMIDVQAVLAQR